jgi:hypothetical protein
LVEELFVGEGFVVGECEVAEGELLEELFVWGGFISMSRWIVKAG